MNASEVLDALKSGTFEDPAPLVARLEALQATPEVLSLASLEDESVTRCLVLSEWCSGILADAPGLSEGSQRLLFDRDELRSRLVLNSSLAPDVQRLAAQSPDRYLRRTLARNHALSVDVQRLLAADEDRKVQAALIGNPTVVLDCLPVPFLRAWSPGLLDDLLERTNREVAAPLAENWRGTLVELEEAVDLLTGKRG